MKSHHYRISLAKEDRIWDLRCQGYDYNSIAKLVNTNPGNLTGVLRRVRRRPSMEEDPVRRGRRSGWLSDAQVADIRARRARGETLQSIGKSYWLDYRTIWSIANGHSYKEPEASFQYDFSNRLRR